MDDDHYDPAALAAEHSRLRRAEILADIAGCVAAGMVTVPGALHGARWAELISDDSVTIAEEILKRCGL